MVEEVKSGAEGADQKILQEPKWVLRQARVEETEAEKKVNREELKEDRIDYPVRDRKCDSRKVML